MDKPVEIVDKWNTWAIVENSKNGFFSSFGVQKTPWLIKKRAVFIENNYRWHHKALSVKERLDFGKKQTKNSVKVTSHY